MTYNRLKNISIVILESQNLKISNFQISNCYITQGRAGDDERGLVASLSCTAHRQQSLWILDPCSMFCAKPPYFPGERVQPWIAPVFHVFGWFWCFFFFNGIHLCKAEEISWSKLLMLKPRKLLLREEFKWWILFNISWGSLSTRKVTGQIRSCVNLCGKLSFVLCKAKRCQERSS